MPYDGNCNCGAIKISVKDEAAEKNAPIMCHCKNCRRQSGGLGTMVMILPDADVTVTGTPKLYDDRDTDSGNSLYRWFCGDCGCPVMSTSDKYEGIKILKLGLFDKVARPSMEIYCKDKAEWEARLEGITEIQAGI